MKKLLILGSSVASTDIINYAKKKNIYTIVSDYLPVEKSKAKQLADSSVMISTANIDELVTYSKENKVDSVFAGVSEFNIECARKVSEALGLPFYYNHEQWSTLMNKKKFKELCGQYKIQTPYTFFTGNRTDFSALDLNVLKLPVIVKPVDMAANIGVSICTAQDQLDNACSNAFAASKCGEILIEQYIDGQEISCTYVIQNDVCKLVCMGTKYPYMNESGLRALAHAYIYPSPCLSEFMEKVNEDVKRMIIGSNLDNCTIFFQGIYKNHQFYFFEAGLRMEGTCTFKINELLNHQNFMEFMVDNALQEKTEYDVTKEDPTYNGEKVVFFSLICGEGTIKRIEGLDSIKNNTTIQSIEQRHFCGDHINNDGTLRQLTFRFILKNEDMGAICDTINYLKENIKVLDENDNNMVIQSFDPSILCCSGE